MAGFEMERTFRHNIRNYTYCYKLKILEKLKPLFNIKIAYKCVIAKIHKRAIYNMKTEIRERQDSTSTLNQHTREYKTDTDIDHCCLHRQQQIHKSGMSIKIMITSYMRQMINGRVAIDALRRATSDFNVKFS